MKIEFVVTEVIFSYMYNFTHTCFDVDAFRKNKILSQYQAANCNCTSLLNFWIFYIYTQISDNFVMHEYLALKTLPSLTFKNSAFCPRNVFMGFT